MVISTIDLGISILMGGNTDVQKVCSIWLTSGRQSILNCSVCNCRAEVAGKGSMKGCRKVIVTYGFLIQSIFS